ncbi:DEAD/DEAH box helicase [Leifsonia sp. YAF41]|uniref:DEAD/DEAH box helicase n=1 Tax=Leifsonia sp. YAF41 TaxID=3233086 RepID=UPI003F98FBAD
MPTPATPTDSGGDRAWKRAIGALTNPSAPSAPFGYTRASSTASASGDSPPVPMALQFELREQLPRTLERWSGPSARTVTEPVAGSSSYRLGVRPVMRGASGKWVKGSLSWTNLSHQGNRLNLLAAHHEWFSQFAALHRAVRALYYGQETDWLYLDEFTSPLLWNLFAQARRLDIVLVGTSKDVEVRIGSEAEVSLDAIATTPPGTARPGTTPPATGVTVSTIVRIDGRAYPPEFTAPIGDHGLYGYAPASPTVFALAPTGPALTEAQRGLLGREATVQVPADDVAEFMHDDFPELSRFVTITSSDASVEFPAALPPVLVLTASYRPRHILQLDWAWEYRRGSLATRVPVGQQSTDSAESAAVESDPVTSRDLDTENVILARTVAALTPVAAVLFHQPRSPDDFAPRQSLSGIDAAEFTERALPVLARLAGVRVDIVGTQPQYLELTEPPQLTFTTIETDQRDWFDLGVLVSVNGRNIPFGPLYKALAKGQKKLLLVDNSYLSLLQPQFEQLRELIEEAKSLQEWETELRISRYQAGLWADFEDLADETEEAVTWRAAVSGLRDLTEVPVTPLPTGVHATLRPYQAEGFNWLAFLWQHQLGGVLADDMGLGKTLQALALMEHARGAAADARGADADQVTRSRQARPTKDPFLVVAPTSVVSNWASEAARFTPGLVVRTISTTEGTRAESLADVAAGADVIITSYTLFRLDAEAYQAQSWAGLILDEAQFVKNHASQAHLAARDLDTPFKLAITGTPMENNLLELHALFAIVAPGLFPSARKFTEDYVRQIELATNPVRLARLRRRIRPFLMRRTKELVASDLPAKQEQTLQIDLNPEHRRLYDTFLQRERQKLLGLIEDLDANRFIVFRSLTLLRLLSLDASLVDPAYAAVPSSKLDALFEQLEDVVAEGHRALIFSQFTSFLKKAAARLDAQGTPYCYLDGSTLRRSEVIDRFKTGAAPVFLISLKAGGFGLNLTEADYVFLLDPWWNPASEAQAVDRTHRIGQTKNVMVYRMVATGTIEEKVMKLKQKKAKLFTAVMDDDAAFSDALSADDIRGLLAE